MMKIMNEDLSINITFENNENLYPIPILMNLYNTEYDDLNEFLEYLKNTLKNENVLILRHKNGNYTVVKNVEAITHIDIEIVKDTNSKETKD
jgi:hypothetical protein